MPDRVDNATLTSGMGKTFIIALGNILPKKLCFGFPINKVDIFISNKAKLLGSAFPSDTWEQ